MSFTIMNGGEVRMVSEQRESEAVKIAADNLRTDLKKVLRVRFLGTDSDMTVSEQNVDGASTGAGREKMRDSRQGEPGKEESFSSKGGNACSGVPEILIGTLGVSEMILPYTSRADFTDENGALRREAYLLKVCGNRLIIAGSDRRGTIYGIYELCEMLGVSPWYFWADVPVRERASFLLQDGYRKFDYPGIEYRGIFINDEEELEHWVRLHMGEDTIGVKTYEKIFELLLRLKGNYIWPAMHVNSFNVKKENGALADKIGVVVGTSHCDMLMRSNNREWQPWLEKKNYMGARYDYSIEGRNREILQEYWRESVEQNQDFEVSYTLGMRGIHDSGFETANLHAETVEELRQLKIELLERIIHDQEEIISGVMGSSAPEAIKSEGNGSGVDSVRKLFIPYKEVLELYDNGLDLPEDLTLVWSNDNYGYVRRYPSEEARKRKGGNGIYYHNSYWAPPGRSYLFISSFPLAQTKYELEKAYDNGIRRLWVTNMGAIKPLEQEMEFVLRLGWETGKEDGSAKCVGAKAEKETVQETAAEMAAYCGAPMEQMSAEEEAKRIWHRTADVDEYLADWIDRNFTGGHGRETAALLNDFAQVTNTRKIEVMEEDVFPQGGAVNEAAVRLNKLRSIYQKGNAIYESLPEEERAAFFEMVLMKIHAAYYTAAMYYFADRSALLAGMENAGTGQESTATFAARNVLPAGTESAKEQAQCVAYTCFFEDLRRRMLVYYNEKMCDGKWNGIVTPEDFPPPRTAMFPAAVPPIKAARGQRIKKEHGEKVTDQNCPAERLNGEIEYAADAESRKAARKNDVTSDTNDIVAIRVDSLPYDRVNQGWRIIKRLGRGGGDLLEAYAPGAEITYPVTLPVDGDYLLELHRYPSLNSVGRIRILVQADNGEEQVLESLSNDEWRGSWEVNTLDQVDRLYLKLSKLCAGSHEIRFRAVDRYFAFSGFVLYPLNNLGAVDKLLPETSQEAGVQTLSSETLHEPDAYTLLQERAAAFVNKLHDRVNCIYFRSGVDTLPEEEMVEEAQNIWYNDLPLSPRPLICARWESGGDSIAATDRQLPMEDVLGKEAVMKVSPEELLARGEQIFTESDGTVRIDAFAAWGRTPYACLTNYAWSYCASETHERSGIALHIREKNRMWDTTESAPSLHYRFSCTGGSYTIRALTYVTSPKNGRFAVRIDDTPVTKEGLYRGGNLWKFEAEHIWRLTPIAKVELTAGEHLFSFSAFASGFRVDRFEIQLTQEN
ncbi:MAG: glycosyl hydrolase 115 family protein [Lachnospiraceae bacterium]|nr:glycosyl hydrolase 115 family protein [Lachnospiraceae bacterium]